MADIKRKGGQGEKYNCQRTEDGTSTPPHPLMQSPTFPPFLIR